MILRRQISTVLSIVTILLAVPLPVRAGHPIEKIDPSQGFIEQLALFMTVLGASRTLEMYDRKKPYDSILPIFKLEGDYQNHLTGRQGFRAMAELGIAFLGGDVEFTRWYDGAARYDIATVHGMYRMAWIREAQLNIAVGYKKFSGSFQNAAFDVGFPLYLFPGKRWSVEAKPYFSVVNSDDTIVYDLQGGLRYKYKLIAIRAGYRYLRIQGSEFHGPTAGLVFEW